MAKRGTAQLTGYQPAGRELTDAEVTQRYGHVIDRMLTRIVDPDHTDTLCEMARSGTTMASGGKVFRRAYGGPILCKPANPH